MDNVQAEEVLRWGGVLDTTPHHLLVWRAGRRKRLGQVVVEAVLEGGWECRVEESVELRVELPEDAVAECQLGREDIEKINSLFEHVEGPRPSPLPSRDAREQLRHHQLSLWTGADSYRLLLMSRGVIKLTHLNGNPVPRHVVSNVTEARLDRVYSQHHLVIAAHQ